MTKATRDNAASADSSDTGKAQSHPTESASLCSVKSEPKRRKTKAKKPKKAMTPFMAFSKETRKALVAANPDLTFSQIGKELGYRWRTMTEDEKLPYVQKANEDYDRFLSEQQDFISKKDTGRKRRTQKEQRNTKVKKSISAYLYFCNAHRNQLKARHPELKMVEIQRKLADKWKKAPASIKLPFEKQAEADRLKYNNDIGDDKKPVENLDQISTGNECKSKPLNETPFHDTTLPIGKECDAFLKLVDSVIEKPCIMESSIL